MAQSMLQRGASCRRIARLQRAASADSATTTEWEAVFLQDVGQRLETFGRAFVDPEKGDITRPVSIKQSIKLREIQRSVNPSHLSV